MAKNAKRYPAQMIVRQSIIDSIIDRIDRPKAPFEFITQTLNPKLNKYPAHKQFSDTFSSLVSVIDEFADDFCVVVEITEKGNVHYHYWIEYSEGNSYAHIADCFKCMYTTFGMNFKTVLKTNKTFEEQCESVYNYMKKDIKKTYQFTRSKQIVMTKEMRKHIQFNNDDKDNNINDLDYN